jgi:hypothetical protein
MRPKYFAGIIIGILIVYLGFMGASGVGLSFTSAVALPTVENFDDLNGWAIYSAGGGSPPMISPAGQVNLHAGQPAPANSNGGTDDRSAIRSQGPPGTAMNQAGSMTIVVRMLVDDWGQGGRLDIQLYTGSWWTPIDIYKDKVKGSTIWTHTNDNSWHNYSMLFTGSSYVFYFESTKLGSAAATGSGVPSSYWGMSLDAWDGMNCHIDFVQIYPGLVVPTGELPPPVGQASLSVDAQDSNGAALTVSISVNGFSKTTPATYGPFTAGTVQLVAPASASSGTTSYGFTRWSDGATAPSRDFNLQADASLTAIYTTGQAPPPSSPGGFPDILGNLTGIVRGILNNGQLRQLEMAVGGLTAVIGGIIFILPGPKHYAPAPPPRYYG